MTPIAFVALLGIGIALGLHVSHSTWDAEPSTRESVVFAVACGLIFVGIVGLLMGPLIR